MFFGVADVVVGDEVGHAMMAFLRVELPAHFLRAQPPAVESACRWIVDVFGGVEEADVEFGVVGDDGQRLSCRPDLVEPLVEAEHRRAYGRLSLEHLVGDAGESGDEFRQRLSRVDELFESRPAVLVAGLYEERADLDECGAFLGIKSGGFRGPRCSRVVPCTGCMDWFPIVSSVR